MGNEPLKEYKLVVEVLKNLKLLNGQKELAEHWETDLVETLSEFWWQ